MSRETIRPSTVDGIKRLAKKIKLEQGIPHTQALEVAAQEAGFQNFRHARNVLEGGTNNRRAPSGHRVFLTAYWHDKELGRKGRETLVIELSTLWSDLVTSMQLKDVRGLAPFQVEGPDHLAQRLLAASQSQARRNICAASRTLQFMDITKLRPSKSYSKAFPGGKSSNAVPGRDHYSIWYDRDTKRYLFADEPYEKAANSAAAERAAWSLRHGFIIAKPLWPGMYNPDGGSRIYLIADSEKGIPLAPVIAALDRLPEPIVEATWNGESAQFPPIFVSPGTIARANAVPTSGQVKKTRRPASGPGNTIGYVQTFVGPRRRPKGKMPIEAHTKVGELLKSVLVASDMRKGVYNRVNAIRSELDEWVMCEYNRAELPDDQLFDLYYHESGSTFLRALALDERLHHIGSLNTVKEVLAQHYPDCSPLRVVLKKIDAAVSSMQTWGGGI